MGSFCEVNSTAVPIITTDVNGLTFIIVCQVYSYMTQLLHEESSASDIGQTTKNQSDMPFTFSHLDCKDYHWMIDHYDMCADNYTVYGLDIETKESATKFVDCVIHSFMTEMGAGRKCGSNSSLVNDSNSYLVSGTDTDNTSMALGSKDQIFLFFLKDSANVFGMCENNTMAINNETDVNKVLSEWNCDYYDWLKLQNAENLCTDVLSTVDNDTKLSYYDCFWYRFLRKLGARNICVNQGLSCRLPNFVIFTLVSGTLCVIGIIGNAASLHMFCIGAVETPTSYQLQALAVVDTVILLTYLFLHSVYGAMDYLQVGGTPQYSHEIYLITYAIVGPIYHTALMSTIWLTVFIAVYRYLAICKPFSNQYRHLVQHGKKYVAMVLIMVGLYSIPLFCEYRLEQDEKSGHLHSVDLTSKEYIMVYHNTMRPVFVTCLPFIILLFVTAKMIKVLRKKQRKKKNMQSAQTSQTDITTILMCITVTFITCQFPRTAYLILQPKTISCGSVAYYIDRIQSMFVVVNSAANPVFYFLMNQSFRSALVAHCRRTNNRSDEIEMGRIQN